VIERYNRPWNTAVDEVGSPRDGGAGVVILDLGDIGYARQYVTREAQRMGLPADQIHDLQLIATELVTNSVRHARGGCTLRLHRARRRHHHYLVCEVSDAGRLTDPLAGRRPAAPHQLGGHGLLMVNDLADLVRLHTGADGTTIAAFLAIPADEPGTSRAS
jgi:anti-sigma regulatory factor (Ser/Thr protein kinase)